MYHIILNFLSCIGVNHLKNQTPRPQHFHKKTNENEGSFIFHVFIRVLHSLFVFAVILIILGSALGMGIGVGYFAYLVKDTHLPTKTEIRKELNNVSEVSRMNYSDGSTIAMIQSDIVRTKVKSNQISPLIKKAVISTEDKYFYKHKGVVPKAVIRALISESTSGSSSGGSTLTQQLVKQQILSNETTFKRKANEILLATQVEKYLSKDEILTTYLNVSPFGRNNRGDNIAGIEEAAQGLFGKSADHLSLPQAAFIAGLPQSPITYTPYTNTGQLKNNLTLGIKRKDFVLFNMYKEKFITKKEYLSAKKYDLRKDFLPTEQSTTEKRGFLYYTVLDEATKLIMQKNLEKNKLKINDLDTVTKNQYEEQAYKEIETQGYTIQSTIDPTIHNAMQNAVFAYGSSLDTSMTPVETGNVLMDNTTGKIYGFVAGRDYSVNQNNHAFNSKRQIGSTIKPLSVYAPAIDQGLIGSESRLANYPITYKDGKPLENAGNKGTNTFDTVRTALNYSYNIPVYNLNEAMKKEMNNNQFAYDHYLSKMNYPEDEKWGYESAPLGTVETNVVTQTNGFQTLANGGKYQEAYLIDKILDRNGHPVYEHHDTSMQVYSPATASIMNDLLRSVIDSKITTPFKPAITSLNSDLDKIDWTGKTGTTNDYRDAWLIISSPTFTLGTWTGHDDNTPLSPNSGNNTGVYVANLVNAIYNANPNLFDTKKRFTLTKDVIKAKVSDLTGEKPGKFTYKGKNYTIQGPTKDSYYTKKSIPNSQYKFGYGGTDDNYKDYWNKHMK